MNSSFEEVTEYTSVEVVGTNYSLLKSDNHSEQFYLNIWERLHSGNSWNGAISLVYKNGQESIVNLTITATYDNNGTICNFIGTLGAKSFDRGSAINDQRLKSVGKLTSGIVHDLNNILSGIIGFTELAQLELGDDTVVQERLSDVVHASNRAQKLSRQLLRYCRSTPAELVTPIQLAPIVQEVSELMRATIPSTIEIETSIAVENQAIMCDETKIYEVVMNLCTNAAQSITGYGKITISLVEQYIHSPLDSVVGTVNSGEYVTLTVTDSGKGMCSEVISKMFNSFYSTKKSQNGTGLGLSLVENIVLEYNGAVTVESCLNKGSTFSVYIPQVAMESALITKEPEHSIYIGSSSILLIDDDDIVCRVTESLLVSLGYRVKRFTDPLDAFIHYSQYSDLYDLVFMDYTMPQITGFDLAKKIRHVGDSVPVIIYTGNRNCISRSDVEEFGINGVLEKPVDRITLSKELRNIFDIKNSQE